MRCAHRYERQANPPQVLAKRPQLEYLPVRVTLIARSAHLAVRILWQLDAGSLRELHAQDGKQKDGSTPERVGARQTLRNNLRSKRRSREVCVGSARQVARNQLDIYQKCVATIFGMELSVLITLT